MLPSGPYDAMENPVRALRYEDPNCMYGFELASIYISARISKAYDRAREMSSCAGELGL